jgi:hypothetical protein
MSEFRDVGMRLENARREAKKKREQKEGMR